MSEESGSGAWKFFVAFGIVALVVVGFYGWQAWQAQQQIEENTYNGFVFRQTNEGYWATELEIRQQPYLVSFHEHPRDVADVIVHPNVTGPVFKRPAHIFITLDPDAGPLPVLGAVDIAKLTGSRYDIFNIPTQSALTRQPNKTVDIPLVTCADATNETTVIQFVHDPEANAIVRDGNCVILFYRTPEESVRVADRYAYALLKIM